MPERELLLRVRAALAERFSDAGHVMQLVTNEHRGHCPPGRCAPICIGYRELFLDLDALVERETARPAQPALFEAEVAG